LTVLLARAHAVKAAGAFDGWAAPFGGNPGLPPERRLETAQALDEAMTAVAPDLIALCHRLGKTAGADLAHTPSAAVVASDLGAMMAWTRVIDGWAAEARRILVVCDEPWLFRHLAGRPEIIVHGRRPWLAPVRLALALRGLAARLAFALRAAMWARTPRPAVPPGGAWLLSYGQAGAKPGDDAYFGDLTARLPGLRRVLHVDCPPARAAALGAPSLHAWGRPAAALALPAARWRPEGGDWLVRRAAAREAGTAQAASIRWQMLCQRAWLASVRPVAVAWPWENHGWERDLVRAARALGVRTAGYQHSTVGRFEFNHNAGINPDGAASLPDRILCVGAAGRDILAGWGVPAERLRIGGALRYAAAAGPRCDPAAPVFVALPFSHPIAAELLAAVQGVAGRQFVVRDHPMNPLAFAEDSAIRRATGGLNDQQAVSAVVYCATTVGLEAVLLGLPTLRFVAECCVAQDILPNNLPVPAADRRSLSAALEGLAPPPRLDRAAVFAPVDLEVWRRALEGLRP
jgi:hypothetical protein